MASLVIDLLLLLQLAAGPTIELTPEDFLARLADSCSGYDGARFWLNRLSPHSDRGTPTLEDLLELLSDKADLSVAPGRASLVDVDSAGASYRVEFRESEWSWIDSTGRIVRSRGVTVVDFVGGRFYWADVPLSPAELSASDRLQIGFLFTVVLLAGGGFVALLFRRMFLR